MFYILWVKPFIFVGDAEFKLSWAVLTSGEIHEGLIFERAYSSFYSTEGNVLVYEPEGFHSKKMKMKKLCFYAGQILCYFITPPAKTGKKNSWNLNGDGNRNGYKPVQWAIPLELKKQFWNLSSMPVRKCAQHTVLVSKQSSMYSSVKMPCMGCSRCSNIKKSQLINDNLYFIWVMFFLSNYLFSIWLYIIIFP